MDRSTERDSTAEATGGMKDVSSEPTFTPLREQSSTITTVTPPPLTIMTGKVNLLSYVLHSHSVLGLCFAADGEAPPLALPCCCIDVGCLTVRYRMFMFALTLTLIWWLTCQTAIDADFWYFTIAICVCLPLICWLKGALPKYSPPINRICTPLCNSYATPVRVEEVALLLLILFNFIWYGFFVDVDVVKITTQFAETYAATFGAELISLIWKYMYCRICCPCCLPTSFKGLEEGLIAQPSSPLSYVHSQKTNAPQEKEREKGELLTGAEKR